MPDEVTITKGLWAVAGGVLAWLGQHIWKLLFFRFARRQESAAAAGAEVDVATKLATLVANIGQEYDRFRDSVEARFEKINTELETVRAERAECENRSAQQAAALVQQAADRTRDRDELKLVRTKADYLEAELLKITRRIAERGYSDLLGVASLLGLLGIVAHLTLARLL